MAAVSAPPSVPDSMTFILDCERPLRCRVAWPDREAASLASAIRDSVAGLRDLEDWDGGRCLLVRWADGPPSLSILPAQLNRSLRQANRGRGPTERIKVRLAIGATLVHRGPAGPAGRPTASAAELLHSQALHDATASSGDDLALIVCDAYFEGAIRGTTQEFDYRQVVVEQRDGTPVSAWIWDGKAADAALRSAGALAPDAEDAFQDSWTDFDAFYRANYGLVRNILNAREQDWALAEEVTDEAMAIAHRKWDDLREHPNQVGWVVKTARRILARVVQQQARRSMPLASRPGEEMAALAPQAEDAVIEQATMRQVIREALSLLPKDQRECLVLYEILDRPVAEIASLLDLAENTVKTRLRSARRALREILGEDPRIEGRS